MHMNLPFQVLRATKNAFIVDTAEGEAYLSPKNAVYLSEHANARWSTIVLIIGPRTERWIIVTHEVEVIR